MAYGTSNLDLPKIAVLLSCIFNIFMTTLIYTNVYNVILSPQGGGWWDYLQHGANGGGDDENPVDNRVGIYPRIWATFLIYQVFVRINWCFTLGIQPELYRLVLLTYIIPFMQFTMECFYYKTLPPYDIPMVIGYNIPYFILILNYNKYTTVESKKKD